VCKDREAAVGSGLHNVLLNFLLIGRSHIGENPK
jgi:hypothetical protein